MTRGIVLDANILIRAVMGRRVPMLIAKYGGLVDFLAPETASVEASTYLPALAAKHGADAAAWLDTLGALELVVEPVDTAALAQYEAGALARIGSRDADD